MDEWHQLQSDSLARLVSTGLSRKVLRHLIFSHELRVGSYVLDVGCGQGELVRFLDRLGFRVAGMDESAGNVDTARRLNPQLDFVCELDERGLPSAEKEFDLVLVRSLAAYERSLLTAAALTTTAHLISCVRPGGHLVFLSHFELGQGDRVFGHSESCYARHLSWFPGTCMTCSFPEAIRQRESWRSILALRARRGYTTATLQCPDQPLPRAQWQRAAEVATAAGDECCCPWSLRSHSSPNHVEHAA